MGACASKFTVLKNASTEQPPAVKCEVESGEVNLIEEVKVEKGDAPAVDDEAKRRQSLGYLLQEGEEKDIADSNGKASENVDHNDAAALKPGTVADAPAQDEREKAPIADGLKSKCAEEDIPANQNVEIGTEKIEDKPAKTLKIEMTEKPQENKAVEMSCDDKEPETLETEKTEVEKPASDEEMKKEEGKLAEARKLEASEKPPETPEAERSEEQCPAPDTDEKETDEKSTAIVETPEKKPEEPEATEEQELASEAGNKNSEEKPSEISNEKPESPETKKAADKDKNMMKEKPAENSKTETSDKVEDKHVLEPQTTENLSGNKAPETCSVEEQKPVSDAEKPKAEEEKAK